MKRIVTVQDISCVGKCSLTVALPIISAMGVETAILPTAVLSTHTQFENFTFHDLTDEIEPINEVWQKEKLTFDMIYTGYLGSFRQIDLVKDMFNKNPGAFRFVDPAMGDNGVLYKGFDRAFAEKMATLCAEADVTVPNLTEACFMLGREYIAEGYDEGYVKDTLRALCGLGAKKAVLTGISFENGRLGVAAMDGKTGEYFTYFSRRIPVSYHGTGDVFSSACAGALARGLDLEKALMLAVDYTVESIDITVKEPNCSWYGVNFEQAIPYLIRKLEELL